MNNKAAAILTLAMYATGAIAMALAYRTVADARMAQQNAPAALCVTDMECAALCPPDDAECDGGPAPRPRTMPFPKSYSI